MRERRPLRQVDAERGVRVVRRARDRDRRPLSADDGEHDGRVAFVGGPIEEEFIEHHGFVGRGEGGGRKGVQALLGRGGPGRLRARPAAGREGEEGEEEGEAFHRVEGLKGLKEFKVERVKGKVAERGGV